MNKYTSIQVEDMLRNYTLLGSVSDPEFLTYKIDLDNSIESLKVKAPNLYGTVLGVFVYGNSLYMQAEKDNVTIRQVIRRLSDGLHLLTMIINGEAYYEG